MHAKDLTAEYPRSPFDVLDGFPWLPRLIDKVRAKHAGTLGEYAPFPCGGDKRFLQAYGIEPDPLEQLIASGATDSEIAAWCHKHATGASSETASALRKAMASPIAPERRPLLEEAIAELKKLRPTLDLSHVENFNQLILAEEGHPAPEAVA